MPSKHRTFNQSHQITCDSKISHHIPLYSIITFKTHIRAHEPSNFIILHKRRQITHRLIKAIKFHLTPHKPQKNTSFHATHQSTHQSIEPSDHTLIHKTHKKLTLLRLHHYRIFLATIVSFSPLYTAKYRTWYHLLESWQHEPNAHS